MAGFTAYQLQGPQTFEWSAGPGVLQVGNRDPLAIVTIEVVRDDGGETYQATNAGDGLTVDLEGVRQFVLSASSYPATLLFVFGSDPSAQLTPSPIVEVGNTINIGTIAGTVTIAGAVTISGPVNVSGSIVSATVSGSVGVTSVGGTVTVAGSVSITNTVTITGTVNIGTITGGTVAISGVSGNVDIVPGVFALTGNGVKLVAVTHTAVALVAGATPSKVLIVKGRRANAGTVYLGISTVTDDETPATGGLQIDPGDVLAFTATDLRTVYINGLAGDGVTFAYWS